MIRTKVQTEGVVRHGNLEVFTRTYIHGVIHQPASVDWRNDGSNLNQAASGCRQFSPLLFLCSACCLCTNSLRVILLCFRLCFLGVQSAGGTVDLSRVDLAAVGFGTWRGQTAMYLLLYQH